MDDPRRPDRDMVEAVLARRPGAFENLVRAHQGLCWHIVERMVRNPHDAQDLCQNTFLRVHRYLHQYRFDSPLKSWIARVAYTVALRHLEAAHADAEAASRLHAAIERLPPLPRTILTLYHLEEIPIPEIARITGIPDGTIKSHLYRSRLQLRRLLEGGFQDE